MIKNDLVDAAVVATGLPRPRATQAVEAVIEVLRQSLARGGRIELRGFGVFTVKRQKAGVGRNPKRPAEDVPIPPDLTVRFRAGKGLRAALAEGVASPSASVSEPETDAP